jgi:hypothetical protein
MIAAENGPGRWTLDPLGPFPFSFIFLKSPDRTRVPAPVVPIYPEGLAFVPLVKVFLEGHPRPVKVMPVVHSKFACDSDEDWPVRSASSYLA